MARQIIINKTRERYIRVPLLSDETRLLAKCKKKSHPPNERHRWIVQEAVGWPTKRRLYLHNIILYTMSCHIQRQRHANESVPSSNQVLQILESKRHHENINVFVSRKLAIPLSRSFGVRCASSAICFHCSTTWSRPITRYPCITLFSLWRTSSFHFPLLSSMSSSRK